MTTAAPRYFNFLLRLWPEAAAGTDSAGWRATLEDPRSGERLYFSTLEQLFAHLMQLPPAGQSENMEGDEERAPPPP